MLSKSFIITAFSAMLVITAASQHERAPLSIKDVKGENYLFPFAGGMNACQFGEVDINMDGIRDLFVFDRYGHRIMPFINEGTAGQIGYTYAPEYAAAFPAIRHWAIFADYDNDGREDLFTYNPQFPGIVVYRNTSAAELRFERVIYPYLTSWYGNGYVNILVTYADYPGISDIDGDGDLDILTFWALGSFVEMHKNLSMETYGHADSLIFERTTWCWGRFAESEESNTLYLDTCFGRKYASAGDFYGRDRHTGSTLLLTDLDNNGTKDLLLGDVDYPQLVWLRNDGTTEEAYIGTYSWDYPLEGTPAHIFSMPAAALVDVDNDGIKDLLASPFDPNPFVTRNHQSVWLYMNEGSNEYPEFALSTKRFLQQDMIDCGSGAYPVFADINLDGLQDLVIGNYGYYKSSWYDDYMTLHSEYAGRIALFLNTGDVANPQYEYVTDDFGSIREMDILGPYPAFGDIDSDDDADMLVGRDDGTLMFYRNCSCLGNPEDFQLEETNYQGIDVGEYSTPFIYDLDEDGLPDLIIGERAGNINYYRNTGSPYEPEFTFVTDSLGKVMVTDFNLSYDGFSTPYVFRGADGLMRLISGSEQGVIYFFTDIEENLTGSFTPSDELWKEVDSLEFDIAGGYRTSAAIADLDNDGYLDLVTGNFSGGLNLYSTGLNPQVSMDIPSLRATENISLKIFPNPANSSFTITTGVKTFSGPLRIILYDLTGDVVLEEIRGEDSYHHVGVAALPEGIYVCRVTDGPGNSASARVVILR
jgi:hypothetical protein